MLQAMFTAASGMISQQYYVNNISNNLANVNTTGFKKSMVSFQDLLYTNKRNPGALETAEITYPVGFQMGHGTRIIATEKIFEQGEGYQTYNPLDVMIYGNGFFQVQMPDGSMAYTRDGNFNLASDGRIVTPNGYVIDPGITVPAEATEIQIAADGTVSVILAGQVEPQVIGQFTLAKFINPAGLESIGKNLYKETVASGTPLVDVPGQNGLGTLEQGYLESSNVQTVEEMINMIMAQRAYEINSKSIQTSDEMMSLANNLKR